MSRSNPTENTPHPCRRWFEWDGSHGVVRYYNKEEKENVDVGDDITFILLDQLSTIKGWHDASDSGIYANEVKDTTQDTLVVKAFKGGTLAEGLYRQIRDRVNALGGYFTSQLYIAFKLDGQLALGALALKGAALNAWVDFAKANRGDLYKKAVRIKGSTEGKKGKIVFKMPKLSIVEINEKTDADATVLDVELQAYLKSYFTRSRGEQVEKQEEVEQREYDEPEETRGHNDDAGDDDRSIPF